MSLANMNVEAVKREQPPTRHRPLMEDAMEFVQIINIQIQKVTILHAPNALSLMI
jgi:hypothetical protein